MHLQSYIPSILLMILVTYTTIATCAVVNPVVEPPTIKEINFEKNLEKNAKRLKLKNHKLAIGEMAMEPPVRKQAEPKYFQEPGVAAAGHYDGRYYIGFVTDEERQRTLTHLVRAWLQWTQSRGIETWLAHGTLLGWWWNNRILPWDTDLDVQVSEATLKSLAENLNMTTWSYNFEEDNFQRDYLLDINPYWTNRLRGTAANLIDGRWIDKSTGLFIDITGLSQTHGVTRPGVISCKNLHRYKTFEIYPLREVKFEDFKAYVPNSYEKILIKEYRSKAFTSTEFSGHDWQPAIGSWVPKTRYEPHKLYRLRNGKMMKMKIEDPRGLEAVPRPSFWELIWRLAYW
ncbi:hypothetical protein TWF569_002600 [Orbilia oligospora]|uniref:LicD/FKTN/FKRP nucleotidyltransferase domain-containing protein n=3 Tax=Orbilia oligospora TaxID=2813651 RepID=A0A7C8JJ50_ORBOL|nr:hypothetical protein TWF102_007235 [Orbilia oligospora]KAF3102814.1 hypothetical protein TWF103_007520 [Orbilia oligospora]KAF3121376.1 hypothetical protein TWF569_002600 [Orbilia oligospora]KAF3134765.1 hypothetical protein TWF594_008687 [Orbilia oligospora]